MAWINKPVRKPRAKAQTEKERVRRAVYGSPRWQNLRKWYMLEHPLCEDCLTRGVMKAAVDVHHVRSFVGVSAAERDAVAYDPENLRSLCKECHQREHNPRKSCGKVAEKVDVCG